VYFLNVKGKNRAYKNKTLFIRLNNKKKNKKKKGEGKQVRYYYYFFGVS